MTKKELIDLVEDAYETGRVYGVADTEEFPDDEKLDHNTFEAFMDRNQTRLTGIECDGLTSEESDHVYQALSKLLQNNLMSIMDTMASDKTSDVKQSEIRWYIDNSEWFTSIMKKMGFDPKFDETISRLRKTHNLTNN